MLGIAINIWPSRYPRREGPKGEFALVPFLAAFMAEPDAFMTENVTSSRVNGNARTSFGREDFSHEEFNGHWILCQLDDHPWLP
jgi:hypothetical protein